MNQIGKLLYGGGKKLNAKRINKLELQGICWLISVLLVIRIKILFLLLAITLINTIEYRRIIL